jgi:orotate phosphoribosyltransferase
LTELQDRLLTIVRENGYLFVEPPIELRSGELSNHFIDGKRALAHGADLELACKALLELVNLAGIDFDAVGGLTLGADQFAHATDVVAHKDWFVVRKERKGRGTNREIEGAELGPGVRVLLVDDVVSTGGSIQQAYEAIVAVGAEVVAAVTLVDRGYVARSFFEAESVPYMPLLTFADLGIPPVGVRDAGAAATG